MKKQFCTLALLTLFSMTGYATEPDRHGSSKHAASSGGHAVHWAYTGYEGPDRWGELSQDYQLCKEGKNQSPIDISRVGKTRLDPIEFHYQGIPLRVVNNGHSIQVNVQSGNYINIGGKRYDLLQLHFHSPSEHRVKGAPYAMEIHFVHKSKQGRLAVIGVFMKEGKQNPELGKIWNAMPKKAGSEISRNVTIEPMMLLPQNRHYDHYNGSLTTPPCSEGVLWFVITTPVEVATQQISAFLKIIQRNARPVQGMNKRFVYTD